MAKLKSYPITTDPEIDLDELGAAVIGIRHHQLQNQRTLVYLEQIRCTYTLSKPTERQICVAGYLVPPTGFFKFLKEEKIEVVPESERDNVESELLRAIDNKPKKIEAVSFWD